MADNPRYVKSTVVEITYRLGKDQMSSARCGGCGWQFGSTDDMAVAVEALRHYPDVHGGNNGGVPGPIETPPGQRVRPTDDPTDAT